MPPLPHVPPPPPPRPPASPKQQACLTNWLRVSPRPTCPLDRTAIPAEVPRVNLDLQRALELVAAAARQRPPPPLPLIDEAEITEGPVLGSGGFGLLRAGTWQGSTPVALKSLRLDAGDVSEAHRRSFEREMRVLFHLRHPNIVSVFGVCHHADARVSLVEELAPRGDLHTLLHPRAAAGLSCQPLPPTAVCRLGLDIARGLAYAHGRGVTHGDLKTQNILLGAGGAGGDVGRAILCDFGLARRVRTALPNTHSVMQSSGAGGGLQGTVIYASPENLAGSEADAAFGQPSGDVYALGMCLYEMGTGEVPWAGKNPAQVCYSVARGERPALPAGLDAGLRACIARCWAQRAGERPTAQQAMMELAGLLARLGGEVSGVPVGGGGGRASGGGRGGRGGGRGGRGGSGAGAP